TPQWHHYRCEPCQSLFIPEKYQNAPEAPAVEPGLPIKRLLVALSAYCKTALTSERDWRPYKPLFLRTLSEYLSKRQFKKRINPIRETIVFNLRRELCQSD